MAIWTAEIKEIEKLYESFVGQLPLLEKELGQLTKTDDPNVLMLYSRRCLEVIVTDLCECELKRPRKTEPLKGIIDKLNKEEKVPSHIITSMDHVNGLSTYGAHPKDFDPEQVKPVLSNLAIIIRWYLKYKSSQAIGKTEPEQEKYAVKQADIPAEAIPKPKKNLILILTSILLIVAIIVFPKIFRRDKLANLRSSDGRISVAVMPFQNMTNDTTWNVWQDGIQDNLITSLSNSKELKVRQTESITGLLKSKDYIDYASITPSVASSISRKLDASVFIHGSIKQSDATLRVNAQLINSKTQEVFKSFQLDGSAGNILHIIDSLSLMVKNFLIISEMEKKLSLGYQGFSSTNSPEAYRYFIYGEKAFLKRDNPTAIKMFSQALAIDSNFIYPAIMLPFAYRNQGLYDQAKQWCLTVYGKREQMTMWQKTFTNSMYAMFFETIDEALKYDRQLLELDDQSPVFYYGLGLNYSRLYQYDKAIPEGEKALEIYKRWNSKPETVWFYTNLGLAYHKTGKYKEENKLYEKAEQDFPDDPLLLYRQAILSLTEGDTTKANKYLEKYISVRKGNSVPEANIITGLANIYSEADIPDKAEKYYREAVAKEPDKPLRMNNLAWFLIENNRNINEGLELINKALDINPDNYLFFDTKGWGLYKQGKYKEALEFLNKSWNLRPFYDHQVYLHIQEVKKALTSQ
jgi:tetratricopeptide (TPR) repeat protein